MDHRENWISLLIKRALVSVIALMLPTMLFVGIASDWNLGQYMAAWTGVSMGTFVLMLYLANALNCNKLRRKGEARQDPSVGKPLVSNKKRRKK